jgi:hypothetical protein
MGRVVDLYGLIRRTSASDYAIGRNPDTQLHQN